MLAVLAVRFRRGGGAAAAAPPPLVAGAPGRLPAPLLALPLRGADTERPAAVEDVERTSLWGEGTAPPGPGPSAAVRPVVATDVDDEDDSEGVTAAAAVRLSTIEQTLECRWRSSSVTPTVSPQRWQSMSAPGFHVWDILQSLLDRVPCQ